MFFNIYIRTNKGLTNDQMVEIQKTLGLMKGYRGNSMTFSKFDASKLKTKKYSNGDVKLDWSCYDDFAMDVPDGKAHVYCYILTRAEAKKLGIKGVKGSYDSDSDNTMEFFIVGDAGKKAPKNRTPFVDEIAWLFCHEFCHGCERFLNGYDTQLTHQYDYEKKDLRALYKQWDWTEWGKKKSFLDSLKKKYAELVGGKLTKPIPEKYWGNSQKYGVKSSLYKRTGTHIGQDHACPIGTKVVAPADGEVAVTGDSKELGFCLIYVYTFNGKQYREVYAHLSEFPKLGKFKRGQQIGVTGNTGLSTGPHLHQEVWTSQQVDVSKLTKDNYTEYTVDPIKHYG